MFVEEFLGFIDLRGQIRTTAAIRMIGEHELTMLLAYLVLGESSFPIFGTGQ